MRLFINVILKKKAREMTMKPSLKTGLPPPWFNILVRLNKHGQTSCRERRGTAEKKKDLISFFNKKRTFSRNTLRFLFVQTIDSTDDAKNTNFRFDTVWRRQWGEQRERCLSDRWYIQI